MQKESSEKSPWKTTEVKFDLVKIPSFEFRECQTRGTDLRLKFWNVLFIPSPKEPLAFWDAYISKFEWRSSAVWEALYNSWWAPESILPWKGCFLGSGKGSFAWFTSHKREFRIYFISSEDCYRGFPQGLHHIRQPQQLQSPWYWLWGLQQQKYTTTKHFPSISGK